MGGPISMSEAVCAGCGKPLGPRVNWRTIETGQAYHYEREPEKPARRGKTLTEHVERAARNVLHGKGQRTLEEDARD
jgi:hypothetical protein